MRKILGLTAAAAMVLGLSAPIAFAGTGSDASVAALSSGKGP